jgi:hypothetical protein
VLGVATVRSRPGRAAGAWIAASTAIIVVPVVGWYVVLSNHSQIHSWLVYRSLPLAFGALSALVYATVTTVPEVTPSHLMIGPPDVDSRLEAHTGNERTG